MRGLSDEIRFALGPHRKAERSNYLASTMHHRAGESRGCFKTPDRVRRDGHGAEQNKIAYCRSTSTGSRSFNRTRSAQRRDEKLKQIAERFLHPPLPRVSLRASRAATLR